MNGVEDPGGILQFPKLPRPAVSVVLWEGPARPDTEALRSRLAADGYQVVRWTSEPHQAYIPHAHIYPELLWLLAGSLTVLLPADRHLIELWPGDRIEVPPGTTHALFTGPDGAEYLIATR